MIYVWHERKIHHVPSKSVEYDAIYIARVIVKQMLTDGATKCIIENEYRHLNQSGLVIRKKTHISSCI